MSRSSWPFSMPMPHIHRKSTAFRSLASAAGVYGSATRPPRPCAPAVNDAPIVKMITSATRVQIILFRRVIMLPFSSRHSTPTGRHLLPPLRWHDSLQRFHGKLGGRQGTFVLQGSKIVQHGKIRASWFVFPGSGTGDLSGLRGEGGFEGDFGKGSNGTHYWFE